MSHKDFPLGRRIQNHLELVVYCSGGEGVHEEVLSVLFLVCMYIAGGCVKSVPGLPTQAMYWEEIGYVYFYWMPLSLPNSRLSSLL